MELYVTNARAKRIRYSATVTYSSKRNIIDIEILKCIDKHISDTENHIFKEKIRSVNAVVTVYKGH